MLNVEIVLHTTTDVYSIGTLLKVSGENNTTSLPRVNRYLSDRLVINLPTICPNNIKVASLNVFIRSKRPELLLLEVGE